MFLKQADGRKSPFPKPWSTGKRPNHPNQRRFNRRQSIPALLPARPRAILYALRFRFAPIEHERPARKSSRHTCGKLRERLSFYYLSPNCAAPLKPMPKPMPFCTSQNRQLIFRQNASAEISRAMLPAHQQTQLLCATDCKTSRAITLRHCVQAVACNYLHPSQWAQPAFNPSFCARAHIGIRK